MGQKTHPLGFRLGITQDHQSTWYAPFPEYAELLQEDDAIRTYLQGWAKRYGISKVQIDRNSLQNQVQVTIETGRPGILVGEEGVGYQELVRHLQQILPSHRQLRVEIVEVTRKGLNATLLAHLVAQQLEQRVAFRRAMRVALQIAQKQKVKGIKIQVSGRLNGAEMARTEWIREGRVPLHTLSADIDYATTEANTIYGVLGIKLWVFKSDLGHS